MDKELILREALQTAIRRNMHLVAERNILVRAKAQDGETIADLTNRITRHQEREAEFREELAGLDRHATRLEHARCTAEDQLRRARHEAAVQVCRARRAERELAEEKEASAGWHGYAMSFVREHDANMGYIRWLEEMLLLEGWTRA